MRAGQASQTGAVKVVTDERTDQAVNEVRIVGTLSVPPQARVLPSGDELVAVRVVVRRPEPAARRASSGTSAGTGAGDGPRRAQVDAIEVSCWSAMTRRAALRLQPGDLVEVQGALRRRFFAGAGGRQSRYDVEARVLRRVKPPRPGSAGAGGGAVDQP